MPGQPSPRLCIDVTTVRAGPYVDDDWLFCFDSRGIMIILSSSVYSDIFQQFESPSKILVTLTYDRQEFDLLLHPLA